jgi:hypothetical protein
MTRGEILELAAYMERMRQFMADISMKWAEEGIASKSPIEKAKAIGRLDAVNEINRWINKELQELKKVEVV